jgi:hypothetical protein
MKLTIIWCWRHDDIGDDLKKRRRSVTAGGEMNCDKTDKKYV